MGCGISNANRDNSELVKAEDMHNDVSSQSNILIKYQTSHHVYKIKLKKPKEETAD